MTLNYKNLLLIVVLTAIAVASWYWSQDIAQPAAGSDSSSSGTLGYYLRDAQIAVIDAGGSVLYEITAESVEERPDENRALLRRVAVRYNPAAEVPWIVRAEAGEIPDEQTYIDLTGGVELRSVPGSSRQATIIESEILRLTPEEYLATTDAAVSVLLGEERLDAVGMTADLKGDYLELNSNVYGQFTR
jgi:lipopolysaccharide export system protein LptC